jgi:hypothetical protein
VHSSSESRSQKREFRNEELRGRRRKRSCSGLRTREREREAGEVEKGVGETQMMAFQQSEDEEEDGPEQVTLQEVRAIAAAFLCIISQELLLCTLVLVFFLPRLLLVDLKVLFLLNIICFFCQGREEAQKVRKDENESKKRLGFFFFFLSLHYSWHASNSSFFFFLFSAHTRFQCPFQSLSCLQLLVGNMHE